MSLEDQPLPRAYLCLHDTTHLHRTCQDHGCDQTEAERHLVRDHLHSTTHGGNDRILVVRTPTCEEDTYHTDRRNGGEQEHTHIEVEHGGTIVPGEEREGTHRADNHEKRSHEVEHLISLVNDEDLLDEHLQHVGKHLQQAPVTYSHRAQTALEVGTDLTLHKYQYDGDEGISYEDTDTHQHALNQYR